MSNVKVKNNVITALLVLLLLVGLGIMFYPMASNFYYQHIANGKLDSYEAAVDAGDAQAYKEAFVDARNYNKQLVGETVPDVFAIREGTVDEDYESRLNILGDQMMGHIEIPKIAVHLPIYHYSTEEVLEKGCGHIFGSSLPVGGKSSHAVITAHRGLPAAKMFTDLDQMQAGDKFYLHILDQVLAYEVDEVEVVKPTETRSLAIERGKDLCTLVTCTPYGVNTNRLLVHGHRVPYTPGDENDTQGGRHLTGRMLAELACLLAGAGAAVGVSVLIRRMREKRGKHSAARGK